MPIDNLSVPLYRLELIRERDVPYRKCGKVEEAAQIIHEVLDRSPVEKLMVVYMDSCASMVGAEIVAVGQLEHVQVSMREIFRGAIHAAVPRIILAHNHPSGDCTPSTPDIQLTVTAMHAGRMLGVEVWDHIVVSPSGTHASIFELGQQAMMDRLNDLLGYPSAIPLGPIPTEPKLGKEWSKPTGPLTSKLGDLLKGKGFGL